MDAQTTDTTPDYQTLAYAECQYTGGDTVTIMTDYENNAETWWDAMRAHLRAGTAPVSLEAQRVLVAFDCKDSVVTRRQAATEIRLWGETLPGWDDGPDHAHNPLVVVEGGED